MTLTDTSSPLRGTADHVVEVVLFDEDPVSRYVLGAALSAVGGIRVVESTDDATAHGRTRPVAGHVAVISASHDRAVGLVRLFTDLGLRTLCLGVGWTRERLDEVFHARASGCLVKETSITRLAAAVRAVASGCVVLSDELRGLQALTAAPPPTASPAAEILIDALTGREFEVLTLLAQGWSTAETAARLIVSQSTVKSHVSHALTKLGVRNRVEAVLLVRRLLDRRNGSVDFAGTGQAARTPTPVYTGHE
ncbi:LuxR C-terminal-related transcriptional regulator [Umezawaea endophytica]|uniref:Response regulator transcription factor n=1 Tax=Umezawaea endophytica TaxID=1654476 RepID=A0A9X2VIT8_9PSEU|nr:response regulator transcription factor [Umezawaea endophytica]MCS7476904.1 response regulator transcription factor [Umezawaea endophytica]